MRIQPPKVTRPLKQYGSLWVERREVYDTFATPPCLRWYEDVYRAFSTVRKRIELRLQYTEEKDQP